MRRGILILALLACGCAYTKATTQVKFDPLGGVVEFIDTKDNSISLKNVSYDPETQKFTLEELTISNMASPVDEQIARQIEAVTKAFTDVANLAIGLIASGGQGGGTDDPCPVTPG